MKRKFATLLGATSAIGFLASNAAAHPGHSPTDVSSELAAPLAGPDHLIAFIVAGTLVMLGAARLALYVAERRQRRNAPVAIRK